MVEDKPEKLEKSSERQESKPRTWIGTLRSLPDDEQKLKFIKENPVAGGAGGGVGGPVNLEDIRKEMEKVMVIQLDEGKTFTENDLIQSPTPTRRYRVRDLPSNARHSAPTLVAEMEQFVQTVGSVVEFNKHYIPFETKINGEGIDGAQREVDKAEGIKGMDIQRHFNLFRPAGSPTSPVGEVFRLLEQQGSHFCINDVGDGDRDENSKNLIRQDIAQTIRTNYGLEEHQARGATIVGERLWRYFFRPEVHDPGFITNDRFRTKRLLHLEQFSLRPGYRENIQNRRLLSRQDLTGRPLGDLGMRDFFTHWVLIKGNNAIRDALYPGGAPVLLPPTRGRQYLDLSNTQLENFDWEGLITFEKTTGGTMQNYWAEMKDADDTRKALVGEGRPGDAGVLAAAELSLDRVDDLKDKLANDRRRRPYYIMALKEEATRHELRQWRNGSRNRLDQNADARNRLELSTEGAAGKNGRNLALESLWQRYFEDTGLTREISVDPTTQLPIFGSVLGGGRSPTGEEIIGAVDVWENIKKGTFRLPPEAVARLLLHVHDRDVINGMFEVDGNHDYYQTLKYFAGVVEVDSHQLDANGNPITSLKPIELLEQHDLNNLIPADATNLGATAINNLRQIDINEENDRNGRPKRTVLDTARQHDIGGSRISRSDVTEDFWQRMWGGHIDERNNIVQNFYESGFQVSSLKDLYANVFEQPVRRKLGFYNTPPQRRLLGTIGAILPLMDRVHPIFSNPGANFAYDRQTQTYYDLFGGYRELYRRTKNLRYHMGPTSGNVDVLDGHSDEVASQFIVARESAPMPATITAAREQERWRRQQEVAGMRPHGSNPDYVINRSNPVFESQQLDPVFAYWLGDGMDNLDEKVNRDIPLLWHFDIIENAERFFVSKRGEYLRPQSGKWYENMFEPGDIGKALDIYSGEDIKAQTQDYEVTYQISEEQKNDMARRMGGSNLDRFLYQSKKFFWGFADERQKKTEPEAVTAFQAGLRIFSGRFGLIGQTIARIPFIPTDGPSFVNGAIGAGAATALVGLQPELGFPLSVAIAKGFGFGYKWGPNGWMRSGARNLWRLKSSPWPIRLASSMSAHDYAGVDAEIEAVKDGKELEKFQS